MKGTPVTTYWERFTRTLVWHPINTDPTDDARSGPTFWYPTYDLIAFSLGVCALLVGSPVLNVVFHPYVTNALGIFLMISATVGLIGVVFPRLKVLELAGGLSIVFMLGGYAGTVMFLSGTSTPNTFVVIVLVMAVWLLGPRVTKLFIQVSRERAARKADKCLHQNLGSPD